MYILRRAGPSPKTSFSKFCLNLTSPVVWLHVIQFNFSWRQQFFSSPSYFWMSWGNASVIQWAVFKPDRWQTQVPAPLPMTLPLFTWRASQRDAGHMGHIAVLFTLLCTSSLTSNLSSSMLILGNTWNLKLCTTGTAFVQFTFANLLSWCRQFRWQLRRRRSTKQF